MTWESPNTTEGEIFMILDKTYTRNCEHNKYFILEQKKKKEKKKKYK